jgi:hypothetical protein
MKINSLVMMLLCIISLSYAQEKQQVKSTISTDFGSYRNRYLYPITNVTYTNSLRKELLFSARIRSYGTLFYFSKTAYDLTPIIEHSLINNSNWKLYAGLGADLRLRLEKDRRGTQATSMEPLLSISPYFYRSKLIFKTPLWTRFYTNGIGFTLIPEIKYQFHSQWSVYGRYELSYFTNYQQDNYQFQRDCFIGIQKRIN